MDKPRYGMLTLVPKERPSDIVISRKRSEIAKRYAAAKLRKFGKYSVAAGRACHIDRLVKDRYAGIPLPDSDDGVLFVRAMAHSLGPLREASRRISQWCMRYAPWFDLGDMERLITDATEHPIRWKADKLGWMLRVTAAERERLGLWTIGAIDQTKEQRIARRKDRARHRAKVHKATRRGQTRAQYEANSAAKTKPWDAAGVSRATWYRQQSNEA